MCLTIVRCQPTYQLVQAVTLTTPMDSAISRDARPAKDTALDWLKEVLPRDPGTNVDGWPMLRAVAPHAHSLAGPYASGEQPGALRHVLNGIALFHKSQGDYQRAHTLRVTGFEITERVFGPDHPYTAIRLGNLAATYRLVGRPADGLPLAERALAITETALGPDHPHTAIRLGNLAAVQRARTRRPRRVTRKTGTGHHRNGSRT